MADKKVQNARVFSKSVAEPEARPDYSQLSYREAQAKAKAMGVKSSGSKADILARL